MGDDDLEKDFFSDDQIVEKVVEEASEQGIPEDSDEDDQAEKNQSRRGEKSTSVGRNVPINYGGLGRLHGGSWGCGDREIRAAWFR
ncbi:hypothetical protein J6590_052016 [Homalodisca vitripennis]|nr:hypothetical protein J6590_052016 [Homalodisca vitripennis]